MKKKVQEVVRSDLGWNAKLEMEMGTQFQLLVGSGVVRAEVSAAQQKCSGFRFNVKNFN